MTLALCISILCTPYQIVMPDTSLHLSGNLSEYDPEVMERTIQHQLEYNVIVQDRVNQPDLFIAVYYCEHLNKFATVKYGGNEYKALVVDCANVAHASTRRLFNDGIIAEVGGAFAAEHDLQTNGRWSEVVIDG